MDDEDVNEQDVLDQIDGEPGDAAADEKALIAQQEKLAQDLAEKEAAKKAEKAEKDAKQASRKNLAKPPSLPPGKPPAEAKKPDPEPKPSPEELGEAAQALKLERDIRAALKAYTSRVALSFDHEEKTLHIHRQGGRLESTTLNQSIASIVRVVESVAQSRG